MRDTFAARSPYDIVLEVKDDSFDPVNADTMKQSFATPAEITQAFLTAVSVGTLSIVIMVIVLLALMWNKERRLRAMPIAFLSVVGLACVVYGAYLTTFDRFVVAEVGDSELRLHYVGPFGEDVVIPQSSIDAILFGTPGKSSRPCYIKILLRSGQSYRSATLDVDLNTCKQLRTKLSEATGP